MSAIVGFIVGFVVGFGATMIALVVIDDWREQKGKERQFECPECGQHGFAIETGETSVAEDLLKQAREV